MDNSVLAEQRRETVINLLKGMKIKKTDGEGFDKDDVYVCMQQLCDVYEKSIEGLTNNYEEQIAELHDKYQKYDENNDLYISLIMEAKKSSNEIITQAKAEVDDILTNGKEQIAKQEEEIEFARKAAEQERTNLKVGTDRAREDAEAERTAIAKEVEEDRNQAEMVKQQYKKRIEAMEREFEEIKTNILRTAGKIDGLKAQINEQDDSHDWEIRENEGYVDVPEPDISVEETFEPAPAEETPVAAPVEGFEEIVQVEEPQVEPAAEVEVPLDEMEATGEELTFEDLVSKLENEEFASGDETATVNLDAAPQVELPDMAEEPAVEVPVEVEEVPLGDLEELATEEFQAEIPVEAPEAEAAVEAVEAAAEEAPIDEISFEGLEELFKE